MIKSIKRGFDFSVGYRKQMLTFIYVKDLVVGVMDALERGPLYKAYFISEDRAYTQQEFRQIVCEELGKKHVLPVTCPLWVVKRVCSVAEWIGKVTLKASTLNRDKFKILKQRNWQCDTSEARHDFDFNPRYSLREGIREAIAWYREAGWL
jgi:nucleoside-diphosphate-sugar epimerase